MTKIQYLSLSKSERFLVNFGGFFRGLFNGVKNFFKSIPLKLRRLGKKLASPFSFLVDAFRKGTWQLRTNFLVLGFYQLTHNQIIRGALYLLYEVVFIWFMIVMGVPYLAKIHNLGSLSESSSFLSNPSVSSTITENLPGDNSFTVLLYCIITFILIIIFIALWFYSIRDAKSLQDNIAVGKYAKNGEFFKDILDKNYHTLLLAVPMVGLVGFTVIPVIFMIVTGFTNYSGTQKYLFDWVGFENYNYLFRSNPGATVSLGTIFFKILVWTLMWALLATFSNYFLGMIVALLINKKGIKLKKLWRTVLIFTIAVPQFVSLLLINQMFSGNGFLTILFENMGWLKAGTTVFESAAFARVILVIVNMWVGVPYTMLICSGILMNIPEDLYESARIDGASSFKMYTSITLPYMLFITGPYLLSQFVGNINNFNIIYLFSKGMPSYNISSAGYGDVGETDLLITWIYKMSMDGKRNYAVACVLGLLVFVIIAFFSLIFYGRSNAVKNEEDFQ